MAMGALIFAQGIGHFGLGLGAFNGLHGGAHDELEALLFQNPFEPLLNIAVHTGGDFVHEFNDRHFGAQARVD